MLGPSVSGCVALFGSTMSELLPLVPPNRIVPVPPMVSVPTAIRDTVSTGFEHGDRAVQRQAVDQIECKRRC